MEIPDITILPVEQFIKLHPEMYFGPDGVSPQAIANSIEAGARVLGATQTKIMERNGWWYICADVDWLEVKTVRGVTSETIFDGPWSFPELCANCCRSEVMARIYSTGAFTVRLGVITKVMGVTPTDKDIIKQTKILGSWCRIVAFRYQNNA